MWNSYHANINLLFFNNFLLIFANSFLIKNFIYIEIICQLLLCLEYFFLLILPFSKYLAKHSCIKVLLQFNNFAMLQTLVNFKYNYQVDNLKLLECYDDI